MNMIQNLVDEVKWRYMVGSIDAIDAETVTEVAEELYPNLGRNNSILTSNLDLEGLVFEALVRI